MPEGQLALDAVLLGHIRLLFAGPSVRVEAPSGNVGVFAREKFGGGKYRALGTRSL